MVIQSVQRFLQKFIAEPAPKRELGALTTLAWLWLIFFHKTLICGQQISRVSGLEAYDILFQSGPQAALKYDTAVWQLFVPFTIMIAQAYRAGCLPLWNPLMATGAPLLADIQSNVFSPWTVFFALFPSLHSLDLILASKILLALLATYYLARLLGFGALSAIFAAITYGFNPYILWYCELNHGATNCILPLAIYWAVKVAQDKLFSAALALAAVFSLAILSSHPESAFWMICFASAVVIFCDVDNSNICSTALPARLLLLAQALVLTGAFCAPVLLPFLEYTLNAHSYKYSTLQYSSPTIASLFMHLIWPLQGAASPTLWMLPASLLPAGFMAVHKGKELVCIKLVFILSFWLIAKIWPMNLLIDCTPLHLFQVNYALAVPLLASSLLATLGLEALVDDERWSIKGRGAIVFVLSAVSIILIACACKFFNISFAPDTDSLLSPGRIATATIGHALLAVLGASFFLLLSASRISRVSANLLPKSADGVHRKLSFSRRYQTFRKLGLITVSTALQWTLSGRAMPAHTPFAYTAPPILSFLSAQQKRLVSNGPCVLFSNTNMVFGISNLAAGDPLIPRRYAQYSMLAGGQVVGTTIIFSDFNSCLLDLASPKFVLSSVPLFFKADTAKTVNWKSIFDDAALKIDVGSLCFNSAARQVQGLLFWHPGGARGPEFSYRPALLNAQGQVVWFGGCELLPKQDQAAVLPYVAIVPSNLEASGLSAGLLIVRSHGEQAASYYQLNLGRLADLATNTRLHGSQAAGQSNFSLRYESKDGKHIRVYENNKALNSAYLVHHGLAARSENDARRLLAEPGLDFRQSVILENYHDISDQKLNSPPPRAQVKTGPSGDFVKVIRPDLNTVIINYIAGEDGILVLTDTFYPGWLAYLDNSCVPIYPANSLFRAVLAPAGNHCVRFSFAPVSFYAGLAICIAAIFCAMVKLATKSKANS